MNSEMFAEIRSEPVYPSASHVLLAGIIFIWKTVADIIFQSENPPAQHE